MDLAAGGFGTGASHAQAAAFGALVFAALCAAVGLRFRWAPAAFLSAVFAAVGVATTFGLSANDFAAPGTRAELGFLVASIAVALLAARAVSRVVTERAVLTGTVALAIWGLLTRAVYVGVALSSTLKVGSWGLTFGWIAYAAALIGIGFGRDARYMRYWGFAVFGTTVGKVFFVDLAQLDPARVALLLVLGLAMIGCGYWYIRNRDATLPRPRDPAREETPTPTPS